MRPSPLAALLAPLLVPALATAQREHGARTMEKVTPTPEVQVYPTPSGAVPSPFFELTVNGVAPFVERWRDVSYARLAVEGEVPVEIRTRHPARDVRVLPRAAVADLAVEGNRVRFRLLRPANLAVLAADQERLFLMADPVDHHPPVPGAPGVVRATAYGADPTGQALATAPLQRALDDAAAQPGGGTVVVPAGIFVTGTLTLRSHVTLYLAPGALLRGSPEPADYPFDLGRHESGSDASIKSADERYRGETMTFSRLLLVDSAEGARIAGRGTIDGDGTYLRKTRNAVPNLVRVRGGRNVELRDVLLRDAAAWTVHVLGARGVRIENVKIVNDRGNLNTDGIDLDASQDVVVHGCLIYTKDDGVCVKATNNSGLLQDVRCVEVSGNVISSLDAALKVGTESQAARFEGMEFRDNDVFDSHRAMSIVVRDGAAYDRLVFRDIRVAPGVAHIVEQVIGIREGRVPTLGRIDHLLFERVEAAGHERPASNWTWYAQFRPGGVKGDDVPVFQGADAEHAVRGLTLRGVVVNGVRLRDRAHRGAGGELDRRPLRRGRHLRMRAAALAPAPDTYSSRRLSPLRQGGSARRSSLAGPAAGAHLRRAACLLLPEMPCRDKYDRLHDQPDLSDKAAGEDLATSQNAMSEEGGMGRANPGRFALLLLMQGLSRIAGLDGRAAPQLGGAVHYRCPGTGARLSKPPLSWLSLHR